MIDIDTVYDDDVEDAFNILDSLEGISGRNDKIAKLKAHKDNQPLKKILYYAYSGSKFHVHLDYESIKTDSNGLSLALSNSFWRFLELLAELENRNITGNAAIAAGEMFFSALSRKEFKWYSRVMNHDLRIGMTDGTITKVFGKEFWGDSRTETNSYGYIEVMLSDKWEKKKKKFIGKSLYMEPKYDGYRLAAIIDNDNVTFYSRGGKSSPYTENLGHVAEQLLEAGFNNCMIDGEIIKDTWNGTGIVKAKPSTMTTEDRENLSKVQYLCFDYLDLTKLTDKKVYTVPLKTRRAQLEGFLKDKKFSNIRLTESVLIHNEKEIKENYENHRNLGHEGSMLKDPEGAYEFDKRSINWLKIKPVHTIDGIIIGFEQGTGKNASRLGAFIVRDSEGVIYKCGQGIKDNERDEFWQNREDLLNKAIIEMEAQDETNVAVAVASARNAVFIRLRIDRDNKL